MYIIFRLHNTHLTNKTQGEHIMSELHYKNTSQDEQKHSAMSTCNVLKPSKYGSLKGNGELNLGSSQQTMG